MKKILALCIVFFIANCIGAFAQSKATPSCKIKLSDAVFPFVEIGDTLTMDIVANFEAYGVNITSFENPDSAFSFKQTDYESVGNNGYPYGKAIYTVYYHPRTKGHHTAKIKFWVACAGPGGYTSDTISYLNGGIISDINDEFPFKEFSITPNPASDFVTVKSPAKNLLKAVLYNVAGEEVFKIDDELFQNNSLTFSVSEFPSGVYYLKLISKENSIIQKIIVNH